MNVNLQAYNVEFHELYVMRPYSANIGFSLQRSTLCTFCLLVYFEMFPVIVRLRETLEQVT